MCIRDSPRIAPFVVAVLPLSRKPALVESSRKLFAELAERFNTDYDETQAIGRRYRRQDEIGTPFCVTFDFDSLDDRAVTIRERDTMAQERIPMAGVVRWIGDRISSL